MRGYTPFVTNAPDLPGAPFDIIGDVHGCFTELSNLLTQAGYQIEEFDPASAAPIHLHHPKGRRMVLVGDLTDRGPQSNLVLRLALGLQEQGLLLATIGNHDWKLARCLRGNKVNIGGGLDRTLTQIAPLGQDFADAVRDMIFALPYQIRLPMPEGHPRAGDGVMTVVHGAAPAHHLDGGQENSFERSIYGYACGTSDDGTILRSDWADDYDGLRWVIHGHEPHAAPRIHNRVIAVDTGCVFGGGMTLYRVDDMTFLREPALCDHSGKNRKLM